tara:strand:- start:3613 stop:4809 length:1197 start_codon:yes stop_codon:yes gene_type:complete
MNILLVSQRFWPENFRINIVINQLKKRNNIYVLTEKPNYPNKNIPKKYKKKFFYNENKNKLEILRVPTISRGNNNFQLFINYLNFICWSFIAIFKFRKKKIELVFVYATSPIFQAISAIFFSKFYKIPSVLWVQDLWPDVLKDLKIINNKYLIFLINYFVNLIYKNFDHIIVQSNSYKKIINKNVKNKSIKVFFNPENSNFKNKIKLKKSKIFQITYAGNIGKAQSVECLVKAVNKIKKEKFIINIFGNGSEKNKLLFFIKKYKLQNKIKYFKPLKFNILKKYLHDSDAFILFLKKGSALSNTLPAKIQTYLSFGKPIIVSSDGEAKNFVKKNKIGFYSNAENSSALSKQIIRCVNINYKKRNQIFNNSKITFFNDIELNNWTKKLTIYFKLISRNNI